MLSVKNIEKSFGDKKVLDGISLTVNQDIRSIDGGAGMRYVMRIFDTPLLEFEASYGEGLQAG